MNGTAYPPHSDSVTAVNRTAVLGCFDGLHIGHRALFEAAKDLAARLGTVPLVISFAEPPSFALSGGGQLLTDASERRRLFAEAGIRDTVFLNFSDVRDFSAEKFVREVLIGRYSVNSAVCGFNFSFGKNRSGNPDTLAAFFPGKTVVCPPVLYGGAPVSSSRIRSELAAGNLSAVNAMLGRSFALAGTPEKGRGDGASLGTPTANIFPAAGQAVPAVGVYITEVTLQNCGKVFPAVTDAGFAPTMDASGRFRLETHLFGFSGILYGEPLSIRFLQKIRGEQQFSSPEALKSAIAADIAAATAFFAKRN